MAASLPWPTSDGPRPRWIIAERRRISACMISSPSTASATIRERRQAGRTTMARTSSMAMPSTSSGMPESWPISARKLPGPCSTTSALSPMPSRWTMRTRPSTTSTRPLAGSPVRTTSSPARQVRSAP
ncbi:hypothetical protein D3C87_1339980 [compost metagenome]